MMDLFDKPKTATDLLVALEHYKAGHMTKKKLIEDWQGMQWSSLELTLWARWQFRENVK